MKHCLFFLFIASVAGAQMAEVHLRVVTFQKAGAATAFEAAAGNSDEPLYAELVAAAAAGTARRVHDQALVIRGGQRSKVEALREYPHPMEFHPRAEEWMLYPTSMVTRNVGQTLEAEATA